MVWRCTDNSINNVSARNKSNTVNTTISMFHGSNFLSCKKKQEKGNGILSNDFFKFYYFYFDKVRVIMRDLDRHSFNVSRLAVLIAIQFNLKQEDLKIISLGGLYHDIGKRKLDKKLLSKKEKLTLEEMETIRSHPQIGSLILDKMGMGENIIQAALYHHERWDGKGYPGGLSEECIPLYSRIISVADAYDAMIYKRSYKKAMSVEDAIAELKRCSGTQFDPKIVEAFSKIDEKEIVPSLN